MVKFMLDPGHDENTPGKGVAGLKEFHFNQAVVERMIELLKGYENVDVLVSHDMYDGIDQSLKSRTDFANRLGVHCFVSVHANAASSNAARGIETFVHPNAPKDTVNLGAVVHGELIRLTGMDNRGLKKADFHVIRETRMNAFLVECGFMTNAGDLAKLKDDGYRQLCAQALVNGLEKHYGLKKKVKPVKTIHIYTGGYGGEALATVQSFIVSNKWWYQPSRNKDGTLSFLVGGFAEGSEAVVTLETFLKERNWWYQVK
jgi:N-acetylmuramoyl-L-alanine amidase